MGLNGVLCLVGKDRPVALVLTAPRTARLARTAPHAALLRGPTASSSKCATARRKDWERFLFGTMERFWKYVGDVHTTLRTYLMPRDGTLK